MLGFERPIRGQLPTDVTAAITPTAPPLPLAEAAYAPFIPEDAAARAAADVCVAGVAAAALQSVVTALAAAGPGKPVAGMSMPTPPASPRRPTAVAGLLTRSDPQALALAVAGVAPDLSPPLTSEPGPPLWAGPWKPASASAGAGLSSVSPPALWPAHLDGPLLGPGKGGAGAPTASEAVPRLTDQGRCPCPSVCRRGPSFIAYDGCVISCWADTTLIAPTLVDPTQR